MCQQGRNMPKMPRSGAIALVLATMCVGAAAQTPIPPSPQDFVTAASQSDHYEILAAQLAQVQGHDERVRAFAQRMIQDHTRLAEDLRRAAETAKLTAPASGMSSDQAMLLSGLQGLRGPEFDKAYARQQVLAHTQAADIEDSFASAGAEPTLRDAARAALPTIKDHLQAAEQLRGEVGGS
jgi:putative membrane protein